MIEVYIDESGNMGREGDYFVLGATVAKNFEIKKKLAEVVESEILIKRQNREREERDTGKEREGREKGGEEREKGREELKFAKMKNTQRGRIVREISRTGVEVFYFTAYKPEVSLMGGEVEKNLVYNYFCRLLIQRVLKRYGDDFLIMFDKRTEAARPMYLGLKDYIRVLMYEEFPHLKNREIRVAQADSRDEILLQVADIVVGAAAQAYNFGKMEFLREIGEGILMMDEFPRGRFRGGKKRLV